MSELIDALNRIAVSLEKIAQVDSVKIPTMKQMTVEEDFKKFISEQVLLSPGGFEKIADISFEFIFWAEKNNSPASNWTQQKITQQMHKYGFKSTRIRVGGVPTRGFVDIKLRVDESNEL